MVKGAGRSRVSRGTCMLCRRKFKHSEMSDHLGSCLEKHEVSAPSGTGNGTPAVKAFHLIVEGKHAPAYWMHLQARADGMLEHLDRFLRQTWLECCGHLSRFSIEERRYSGHPMEEYAEGTMKPLLGEVLLPGIKFSHIYDYGSTTHLALMVVSEFECSKKGKPIQLLASNDLPPIQCQSCGKPALLVCPVCYSQDYDALYCRACAARHDCEEEGFLPVVNSPRLGVCGYTGEAW